MRKRTYVFLALFLIVQPYLSLAGDDDRRIISVMGEAESQIVPDQAVVSMTIEIKDKNLNVAQKKNDEITAQLIKFATGKLGIDSKFVQTSSINIQPVYNEINCHSNNCPAPTLNHFVTSKGINIILKNTKVLQDLIEQSLAIGVTRVENVEFTSSDLKNIEQQVQVIAAKNAKQKASEIAKALGVEIGKPQRVTVNYSSPIFAMRNMKMASSMANVLSSAAEETIAVGQITVKGSVSVDFEIEK